MDPERPARIVEFVRQFHATHGYAPNFREVAIGVGLASISALNHHLLRLKEQGLVTWTPGIARSIRIVAGGSKEEAPVATSNREGK